MKPVFVAIGQLLEFILKACAQYALTPEGGEELQDVIQALGGDENPEADNVKPAPKERKGL